MRFLSYLQEALALPISIQPVGSGNPAHDSVAPFSGPPRLHEVQARWTRLGGLGNGTRDCYDRPHQLEPPPV